MLNIEEFKNWILPVTLKWEGGYVNDKIDKGGETYRGISRRNNPDWRGWELLKKHMPLSKGDIVNDNALKEATAELYFEKYFKAHGLHRLNANIVGVQLFDFAVHGGYSVKGLQGMLNRLFNCDLTVDGVMGEKTLAALNAQKPDTLAHAILTLRCEHLKQVVANDPTQQRFERGWTSRTDYLRHCIKVIQ